MKKLIMMFLCLTAFTALVTVQTANAQDKKEPWPGITVKVLSENEHVKVFEMSFTPGSFADWHSHPQHTIYALTDMEMQEEIKDKETAIVDMKAGQVMYSPAVTHKTTNVGKMSFHAIVTEIKEAKPATKYCCPKCDFCSAKAETCPHHNVALVESETEIAYCCGKCDWTIPTVKGECPHSTASLYKDGELKCVYCHPKGGKCTTCRMAMEKIEIKKKVRKG